MNIEVPTKYQVNESQRQNRCFSKSSPQRKSDALQTCAPWQLQCFWVSLEERSRTNSLRQRFHSAVFSKSSGISAGPCIITYKHC
jgi:hypothetical protein